MSDVADDARLFIDGIGSRYFAEVVAALHNELTLTDPVQAGVLDTLCTRLVAMRDLLEKRLAELKAEVAEPERRAVPIAPAPPLEHGSDAPRAAGIGFAPGAACAD